MQLISSSKLSLTPKASLCIFPAAKLHNQQRQKRLGKYHRLQPAAALTFFTSQPEDTNNEDSKLQQPLKKKKININIPRPAPPPRQQQQQQFVEQGDPMAELWDRTLLLRRQLTIATDANDFHQAIRIKAELFSLVSKLSSKYMQIYLNIETVMDPTAGLSTKRAALNELRLHGDISTLPIVSSLLGNGSKLKREAEEAAAAIRHRSMAPAVVELCRTGAAHLVTLLSATGEDENEVIKVGAEAVAVYSTALEHDQYCATALAGRGAALYCLRQYEAAAEDLESAVHYDPWNTNAARILALTHGQLKQFSSAHAALGAAAVLNPNLLDDRQHMATKRVINTWEGESNEWKQTYLREREAVENKAKLERLFAQTPTTTTDF